MTSKNIGRKALAAISAAAIAFGAVFAGDTSMIVSAAMVYVACALLPFGWMNHEYLFLVMWALILPGSVGAMIWVISAFSILFNNFINFLISTNICDWCILLQL